jgi:hypothetical protein
VTNTNQPKTPTPQRTLVNQLLSQLKDQYRGILPPDLRVDLLPAGQGPLKNGVSGATYRAGSNGQVGGKSRGRTPYIVLQAGTDPVTTRNALLHEVGHELEPFLIRTPDRAKAFAMAFSKHGDKIPAWLNPPKNSPNDVYGMSYGQGRNMGLSPIEYYANLVSGQLGTPTWTDLRTPEAVANLASHDVTPAANIPVHVYQRLLSQGLIPKPFKGNLGSDIQLGA